MSFLFYSYMISILEKAMLFDMKLRKEEEVSKKILILSHNLSFIDTNRKYLLDVYVLYSFRYIFYTFFLTICSRQEKKNHI